MVSWGVREKLEVIWSVLVVRCNVEGHESVKELLAGLVVAEQSVAVDVVQLALTGRGATTGHPGNHTHIQA